MNDTTRPATRLLRARNAYVRARENYEDADRAAKQASMRASIASKRSFEAQQELDAAFREWVESA